MKGLVTRKTRVKYQGPTTYHLKDVANILFFKKQVKHQGQSRKVKNFSTHHVKYQSPCTYQSKLTPKVKYFWRITE
jgi:hypothetical protein